MYADLNGSLISDCSTWEFDRGNLICMENEISLKFSIDKTTTPYLDSYQKFKAPFLKNWKRVY